MTRKIFAAIGMCILLASCATTPEKPATPAFPRGGVLRVAVASEEADTEAPELLDPQKNWTTFAFELSRCCLLRTLMTAGGAPTSQGGAELHPDLAARLPDVSADGLVWTFTLRSGIRYAPPLQAVEVTSADIIRALEREAKEGRPDQGGYSNYFEVIQGFEDFAAGKATSIAGAQAPDAHTLLLRLTRPTGDLGYRFGMPATAPIPPARGARLGAADGHPRKGSDDGYGHFLVSLGPYMIKGSDTLQPSMPPASQTKISGIESNKIVLVRNPSWSAGSDPWRPAYVDEIDLIKVEDSDAAARAIDDGTADIVLTNARPPQAPVKQIERYRADPSLGRVEVDLRDSVRWISMNLAMPPFDDVHVRKAMNLITDKTALIQAAGGPLVGTVSGHVILDSSEHNLLVNYDPYQTPGSAGSFDLAAKEMRQSSYDANHDGKCDHPACKRVAAYYYSESPVFTKMAPVAQTSFAKIGIQLVLHGSPTFFDDVTPLESKIPLALFPGWGKDYINPSNFVEPLFASSSLGNSNWTFTGASPEQLRKAGYKVASVPSIDDRIKDCFGRVGSAETECWSNVDQYLTETVVATIPFMVENYIQVIPARIAHYSFDQADVAPALEQIALKQ